MLQPGFLSVLISRTERTNIELSKAESETESKLEGIQNLIQLFVEYHTEWRQLASVVAGNTSWLHAIFSFLHCSLSQQL